MKRSGMTEWGYEHKSVCHGTGEYARDEDGDGFHEVHVNTMEGFFQFVHNVRQRGNSLLCSLVEALVCVNPEPE